MIIYAFFIGMSLLGLGFLIMGIQSEMNLFSIIGPLLGAPGFLPESMSFFILSWFIMFFVMIGVFVRIHITGCSKRFDKPPRGKSIFNYIYRDGLSLDLHGIRRPGMGIFDLPTLGVIMDIGRLPNPGSVYNFGGKKIRFALQDINFTPNPKFTSIYSFFASLGFNNMEEVQDVLNGYNPSLMVKIWNKLVEYEPPSPEKRLVENIKQMNKHELKQNNQAWKDSKKSDYEAIDKIIEKKEGKKGGRFFGG